MFAIVKIGGTQYKVAPNQRLKVAKLKNTDVGAAVAFDKIYLVKKDSGEVLIGKPIVKGAKVIAQILQHGRGKKVWVFKYKPKTRYRKTKNFRPQFTEIQIQKIEL